MTEHTIEVAGQGPSGELTLQTLAMPRDTNANGDIFGNTSAKINIEVWTYNFSATETHHKVADGLFVFVAIDDHGQPRTIPR